MTKGLAGRSDLKGKREERQGGLGKRHVSDPVGVGTKRVGLYYVSAYVCQRAPSTEEVLNSMVPCGGQP